MRKIIRHGIFESNSSSMHSLILVEDNISYDTIQLDSSGVITVMAQQMDQIDDQRICNSKDKNSVKPEIKLKYLFSYVMTVLDGYQDVDCTQQLSQQKTNSIQFRKSLIRKVVMQHTGASDVVFICNQSLPSMSIGGTERTLDYILQSDERIRQFIFGTKSKILIIPGN